jgi:hypothetical protein
VIIEFTILGEPASKANSRKIARFGKGDAARFAIIKSEKARNYVLDALPQIPQAARQRLEGPVRATLRIWYASERSDLDESLVLDVLQDRWSKGSTSGERRLIQAGVIRNDRQVREKHVYHGIDPANPRTEISLEPVLPQQLRSWSFATQRFELVDELLGNAVVSADYAKKPSEATT